MKPTPGRIVHYVVTTLEQSVVHRPAIVTAVADQEACCLAIFHQSAIEFREGIPHDEGEFAVGSWHWPERDEEPPLKVDRSGDRITKPDPEVAE